MSVDQLAAFMEGTLKFLQKIIEKVGPEKVILPICEPSTSSASENYLRRTFAPPL